MRKYNTAIAMLMAIILTFSMAPIFVSAEQAENTQIIDMKADDFVNPIGIDSENPIFSWKMDSSVIGQHQTAFRLLVAKDNDFAEVIWDSEKQPSGKSVDIQYAGSPLESSKTYFWKVSVWDKDDVEILSDIARFEMGLLDQSDWSHSNWIQVGTSTQPPTNTDKTNYTIEADIQIVQGGVALLFEATNKQNFLMWQFNENDGKMTFKPHYNKSGYQAIAETDISEYIDGSAKDIQKLKIELSDQSILTYLNDKLISTIPASGLGGVGLNGTIGRLGFRAHSDRAETGWLDNIIVADYAVDPQGLIVKSYDFEDGVNPFDGGTIVSGRLNAKPTSTETVSLEKEEVIVNEVNYTVEADVTCSDTAVSLLFSARDNKNFYMLQLNTKDENGRILFKPHTWKDGAYALYASHNKDVTSIIGSVADFAINSAHVKIDVTESEIKTYINDQLVDTFNIEKESDGIPVEIGYLGFRTSDIESGTVDNYKLTDYTNSVEGEIVYDYDFESYNPFLGGSIENGVFHTYGTGILMPMEAQGLATFRKEITPELGLVSAKLYTAGLGVYDVYINGNRVGTKQTDGSIVYDELKPGYTHQLKRTIYSTYDILHMLDSEETSTISASVSSGWWSGQVGANIGKQEAFRAQILLTYSDGSQKIIGTDRSWKSSFRGPILMGDIYHGETYDANADLSFRQSGYNDSNWYYTDINKEFNGEIRSLKGPAVQVREDLELTPKSITIYDGAKNASESQFGIIDTVGSYTSEQSFSLNPNETAVIDLGQNFAGWENLVLEGTKGTVLTIRHAEILNDNMGLRSRGNDGPEGSVYTANLRTAKATTRYIMSGNDIENYNPTSTFYGFRYLEIKTTNAVTIHNVKGEVVTSVATDTGDVSTSNEKVNQLISNIFWGQYSNYLSTATDCPQRDERKGWTADTQVFVTAAMYNADSKGFLRKYMDDMNDSQSPNGAYPSIAPNDGYAFGGEGQLGWADAGIIIPYNLYKMTGDTSIIEENYVYMQKYMDVFMASTNKYGGGHAYGDWLAYESNDTDIKNMLAISYYAWDAQMMAEMASVLGKTDDVTKYDEVYEIEKQFFQELFVNPDGSLKRTEQSACLFALKIDLLPNEESREIVKQALSENIQRNGNKLQTGFLGTSILMPTLSDLGLTDVAYQLLLQEGNPSWLYSVNQGATTIWERWNSYTLDTGFGDVGMNSFNHYAYGAVIEWMYSYMAGIMYDIEDPGFKHIILQPHPEQSIQNVDASYNSAYGTIVSNWKYEGPKWSYSATIPANTTATMYIPVEEGNTLIVNGKSLSELTIEFDGIKYDKTEDGKAIFEAVAGSFDFTTDITEYRYINLSATNTDFPILISVDGEDFKDMPQNIKVVKGETITLRAMAKNDFDFVCNGWSGDKVSDSDTITLSVEEDIDLIANVKWIGNTNIAEGKPVSGNSDWVVSDWAPVNLTDGILTSKAGSLGYTTGRVTTVDVDYTVDIDLGENMDLNRIQLYPRSDDVSIFGGVPSFPKDFSLEICKDGESQFTVVESYTNYVAEQGKPSVFTFDTVDGRYVRLHVTKLGERPSSDNLYDYLQLAEMGVYNVSEKPKVTKVTLTSGEDSKYIAKANIFNSGTTDLHSNLIVAIYDEKGVLQNTEQKQIVVNADDVVSEEIIVDCDKTGYQIKAFIWEASTYVPLCDNDSISVE